MEHLYVEFDDSSCVLFWDIVRKNVQLSIGGNNLTPMTAIRLESPNIFMGALAGF